LRVAFYREVLKLAPAGLTGALLAAADALVASAGELNTLDGFAGDGDLGITMSEVADAIKKVVSESGAAGPAELLSSCGAAIARSAPSTSGTLVATGFLRAAKALSGPALGPTEALARCCAAALEGIQARGKASLGERTLLDGLDAVCRALAAASGEGAGWEEALAQAAKAAASAAQATAAMEPRAGRASWMPGRALGHPDAGCMALSIAFEAAAASAGAT
jgi:dihydroxyacetone kinase-like protein